MLDPAGGHWEGKEDLSQAVVLYEEALRIDPCAEDICRKLMSAYHQLGRPTEVISIYNGLIQVLQERFGIEPSEETKVTLKNYAPGLESS